MKTNIGVATLMYDKSGKVTAASFAPAEKFDKIDLNQLAQIKPDTEQVIMERNAEMVLANWFTRVNEIELADRDEYKISTEVLTCERYSTGEVMIFQASFSFEKI